MLRNQLHSIGNPTTKIAVLVVMGALFWFGCTRTNQPKEYAHLQLTVVKSTPHPGGSHIVIGGHVRLTKGWHTYWINPGDAGLAPRLEWKTPQGIRIIDTRFSMPKKIKEETVMTLGYDNDMWLKTDMDITGDVTGSIELEANLLICKDICIPVVCTASVEINTIRIADAIMPQSTHAVYPQADSSFQSTYVFTDTTITFFFHLSAGKVPLKNPIDIFPVTEGIFDLTISPYFEEQQGFLVARVKRPDLPIPLPDTIVGLLFVIPKEPQALVFKAIPEVKKSSINNGGPL